MNEKIEVYEKMIKDAEFDIKYYTEKLNDAKLRLEILTTKKPKNN